MSRRGCRVFSLLAVALLCAPLAGFEAFANSFHRLQVSHRSLGAQQQRLQRSACKTMRRDGLQNAAGAVWLLIGAGLLARGRGYLQQAVNIDGASSRAVTTSVVLGLLLGLAKGRFVLSKVAIKNIRRIESLQDPKPWQIFSLKFYPLMLGMMGLSVALRKLFRSGFAGGMVTYGGLVSGIGTALFVSAFAYWFEDAFGVKAKKSEPTAK
ncbi:hypothetical protein AK812_SmicGene1421 [Symbiodinium microadriaticum]|uniref:Uncharacterized protein n=1 Tax=Symbiodinium microadriaticum TaxID=2951 RepID=A0A1Q9F478_SYMMI|nr:hypothetical protein AK812_SmicGene1421 [Symbiodinium microadriaticum]CAE7325736.1 unnamed protein product [Symbiodinium microadriaticum]CAE7894967.1 unnamed protein product [Symbiodinium sp. KB8]